MRILLIDNHDSFVYNLVDALRVAGYDTTVYRNTVSLEEIERFDPAAIVLSPGPGHPSQAGSMMEIITTYLGKVPILGICLGFQALIEHHGGVVEPCGPIHGQMDNMLLTNEGVASGLFDSLTVDAEPDDPEDFGHVVPVARYHSLGTTTTPEGLIALATAQSTKGEVLMAATTKDHKAIGVQYHPESILTPAGPIMITRFLQHLLQER